MRDRRAIHYNSSIQEEPKAHINCIELLRDRGCPHYVGQPLLLYGSSVVGHKQLNLHGMHRPTA